MRRVNRVFTNPVIGTFAWLLPPLAVVHHVGRKSGRSYRAPVVAFPYPGGIVIPMTYGRDVDWGRNLLAAGGGGIQRLGRRREMHRPRIVGIEEAHPLLPPVVRDALRAADFPGYLILEDA